MAERATKIDLSTVSYSKLLNARYWFSVAADEMYAGAYLRAPAATSDSPPLKRAAANIETALDALGLVAVPKADADPLRDAAHDLLALVIQYRDDLRHPPSADSRERRLEAIEAAIAKAKGGEG